MALTTVSRMKSMLGIKVDDVSQDAKLSFFIDAASRAIEGMTGRVFSRTAWVETISGTGSGRIIPMQYPVLSVATISVASDHAFTNPIAYLDSYSYGIGDGNSTIVSYAGTFSRGTNNIQYVYEAGYDVIPADLELAAIWTTTWYYNQNKNGDIGRSSKSKGDESTSLSTAMPAQIKEIIQQFKRYEFPNVSQSVRLV